MPKVKLTKGELKRQRDALRQYERYLPTLQLKKQQLQLEILHQLRLLEEKEHHEDKRRRAIEVWAGLFTDTAVETEKLIKMGNIVVGHKNISGVELPVFEGAEFENLEYDFFIVPLWADAAIESLKELISIREELKVIKKGVSVLRSELRVATQRVNLFEKVKIPEAEEAIRLIKIYIGDQMANAVGRSKIAKKKIEAVELQGAVA